MQDHFLVIHPYRRHVHTFKQHSRHKYGLLIRDTSPNSKRDRQNRDTGPETGPFIQKIIRRQLRVPVNERRRPPAEIKDIYEMTITFLSDDRPPPKGVALADVFTREQAGNAARHRSFICLPVGWLPWTERAWLDSEETVRNTTRTAVINRCHRFHCSQTCMHTPWTNVSRILDMATGFAFLSFSWPPVPMPSEFRSNSLREQPRAEILWRNFDWIQRSSFNIFAIFTIIIRHCHKVQARREYFALLSLRRPRTSRTFCPKITIFPQF